MSQIIQFRFYKKGTLEIGSARYCLECLAKNVGKGEWGWIRKSDLIPIPEDEAEAEKELRRLEGEASSRLSMWESYQ